MLRSSNRVSAGPMISASNRRLFDSPTSSKLRHPVGGVRDALRSPLAAPAFNSQCDGTNRVSHDQRTLLAPSRRKRGSGSGCDARRLSTGQSIRAWGTLCGRQMARNADAGDLTRCLSPLGTLAGSPSRPGGCRALWSEAHSTPRQASHAPRYAPLSSSRPSALGVRRTSPQRAGWPYGSASLMMCPRPKWELAAHRR